MTKCHAAIRRNVERARGLTLIHSTTATTNDKTLRQEQKCIYTPLMWTYHTQRTTLQRHEHNPRALARERWPGGGRLWAAQGQAVAP